ncbi:protein kinase [Cryptotrichosporon argae]
MDVYTTPRPSSALSAHSLGSTPSASGEHDGPVTDFSLIESQKENIRPLASGRSAATLGALFKGPTGGNEEVEKAVIEGHQRFKREIEAAEVRDKEGQDMEDGVIDVLDPYHRYALFMVQHYPSTPAEVLPLLESTTRRFVADARFAQDMRYLKLWVMYARLVERREEVWAFLSQREVGTSHAVFYEEWAIALEGLGRKKKADEIYKLGIARRAAPVERLKTRHAAFLARIMAPPSGELPDDEPAPPRATPARTALGAAGATPLVSGSAATPAAGQRLSRAPNGAKMAVFQDGGEVEADEAKGEWADFGTRDGRRKENVVEATAWKGETMPLKGRVAPRTPKLEVFKDTSDDHANAVRADDVLGGLRKQPPTEAEMIRANPLRHFDVAAASTSALAIPSLPAPPAPHSARKPKPKKREAYTPAPWVCPTEGAETRDSKGKVERRAFDWDAVYRGGEEWSFEEVRARARGMLGKDSGEVKAWERAWHKPGSSTPKPVEKKKTMPSPTVNTKLANEDVMSLFNQTIHGGKIADDSDSASDSDDDDEGDVVGAPTPLPQRGLPAMLAPTPGTMVPPTPTPFPRAPPVFDENAPAPASLRKLNVFADAAESDENAVPSSAVKRNVFDATPMRAQRTPLAPSSKLRVFGVFSDAEAETPAPKRALGNLFAAPALAQSSVPTRKAFGAITEDEEEEATDARAEDAGEGSEEMLHRMMDAHAADTEADAEDYPHPVGRPMRRVPNHFDILTPITERTCEFTTTGYTTTTGRSGPRRSSIASEAAEQYALAPDAEDAEAVAPRSHLAACTGTLAAADLSAVAEEEEELSRSPSPALSPTLEVFGNPSGYDRSGSIETAAFGVPDGYTIAVRDGHTALSLGGQIVDRSAEEPAELVEHSEVAPAEASSSTSAAEDLAVLPNPCNPSDDAVIDALLAAIQPPLAALPGYVDASASTSGQLDTLQRSSKSKARRSSTSSRITAPADDGVVLDLGGRRYEVRDKIGEGGYGAVFLAIDVAEREAMDARDDDDDASDDDEDLGRELVALKVEKPAAIWEAVVLDRIHRRLDASLAKSVVLSRGLARYADESFLVLDYSAQGTLLDVVNKAQAWGISSGAGPTSVPDELLALFFVIELLKLVEGLHAAGFIHGDLKIDNCLVRLDAATSWSGTYARGGADGWNSKGLRLIDFGRGIDLDLFPAGRAQRFTADWKVDERDCVEMREGRDWAYETDYYGLAGIAYCLLYGKYIATEAVETPEGRRYKIDQPLKRYWQTELWTRLFDALLNPHTARPDAGLPITQELAAIRADMEAWLEDNCNKGGKMLKSMLKRIELRAIESRRAVV